MANHLVALYKHNLWANLQMLDTCEKLSDEQLDATFPGTYGCIRDTLLHLFGAEERYVDRLTGRPRGPHREREGFKSFDELRARGTDSGETLISLVKQNELPEVLSGTAPDGRASEVDADVLVLQVINHATEHRAHINTLLTQFGVEPLELDGWAYGEAHGMIRLG